MRVQSLTEIKPPADCRNAQLKMSAKQTRIPQQERRGVLESGVKKIIVCTNSNLVAPRNYESVGFRLYDKKKNDSESAYTGDYLYYEIKLQTCMK